MKITNLMSKILASIAIVSMSFSFTGCFLNNNQTTPSNPDSDNNTTDDPSIKPNPDDDPAPIASITFSEFVRDYNDKAVSFVSDFVNPKVTNHRTLKNETISISANEKDELSKVDLLCTYSLDGTNRVMEYTSIELENAIDLDKIVEGKVTSADVSLNIDTNTVLSFDARTVATRTDVANRLYTIAVLSDYSDIKIFGEVESNNPDYRAFDFVELDGNNINVRNVEVFNEGDDTLLKNLHNWNYIKNDGKIKTSYKMSGTIIQSSSYVLEEFGSITDPANPSQEINSVTDLVTNFSDELSTALENNFMSKIREKVLYDAKDITSTSWDLGTSDTISEVKLIANYERTAGDQAFSITSIKLKTPINIKDINEDNIDTIWAKNVNSSTYGSDYFFSYNASEQGTRDNLINAIFEANGMGATTNGTRLFVDRYAAVVDELLGTTAHGFTVVEINENGIKEFSINIKSANDDQGLINNLKDSANYRVANEKSCECSQNQVTKNK